MRLQRVDVVNDQDSKKRRFGPGKYCSLPYGNLRGRRKLHGHPVKRRRSNLFYDMSPAPPQRPTQKIREPDEYNLRGTRIDDMSQKPIN
jgi:hypothetical protein